jgi:HEAT repeat protein
MPPPERAAEIRSIIVAWLECDECSEGELAAVVKLGQAAVPSLAASLRDGPSPARREQLRRHLEESHARLKDRSRTSAAVYVPRYTENLVALYRVRAARALSAIGGPVARQALEDALGQPYRDDVRQSIKAALTRLGKP